jgi:hypothetical protein
VVVHAETVERSGDVQVATPEAAGYYRDHRGEEFIKVYFPEVVNASLQNFDARIKLGCCKELDPDNYETLGDIYVQGMRVKVHAGSWTDIFVHKKAPFFPDM